MAHNPKQLKTTPPKPTPAAIERRIAAKSGKVTMTKGPFGTSRGNPQAGNKMGKGNVEHIIGALKKDTNNPAGMQRINKFKGFKK